MTQFNDTNYKEYEELFTYANNKLVEQTMYSFYSKVLPPIISKKVFEYKQDNITKMTYFYEGEAYIYEQYSYTCDK